MTEYALRCILDAETAHAKPEPGATTMDACTLFSLNSQEHAARAPFPTATPKPFAAARYYAGPSKYSAGSWNVYDRQDRAPEGGHAVEEPHLTHKQAMRRAEELNAAMPR